MTVLAIPEGLEPLAGGGPATEEPVVQLLDELPPKHLLEIR